MERFARPAGERLVIPGLKICGITRQADARACVEAGAAALGAKKKKKSPRHVTPELARNLFQDLPDTVARVGVFVDRSPADMIAVARTAGLDTIQLHGREPLETVCAVRQAGFHVVKVLKSLDAGQLELADALPPETGILIECGKGVLPGGNAAAWNWSDAAPLAGRRPVAIAGGLTPDNIRRAAECSQAAGFDISSGVESAPGIKSAAAVAALAKAMAGLQLPGAPFSWKGTS